MAETTNEQALAVDYFSDFLQFLNSIKEKPIQRTATGNITLAEIAALSQKFRQGKQLQFLDEKMGWKIRTETECQYLHQMRVTAECMYIIYKRRGQFLLSKHGKAYLENLKPTEQYDQMILWFWNRVNWEYFSPGRVTAVLQKHQHDIWKSLFQAGDSWIEFKPFCQALKLYLRLEDFYKSDQQYEHAEGYDPNFSLYLDIRYGLIERNLKRFGCVETVLEKGQGKYDWHDEIIRFRSTNLGLRLYELGLEPFWAL